MNLSITIILKTDKLKCNVTQLYFIHDFKIVFHFIYFCCTIN